MSKEVPEVPPPIEWFARQQNGELIARDPFQQITPQLPEWLANDPFFAEPLADMRGLRRETFSDAMPLVVVHYGPITAKRAEKLQPIADNADVLGYAIQPAGASLTPEQVMAAAAAGDIVASDSRKPYFPLGWLPIVSEESKHLPAQAEQSEAAEILRNMARRVDALSDECASLEFADDRSKILLHGAAQQIVLRHAQQSYDALHCLWQVHKARNGVIGQPTSRAAALLLADMSSHGLHTKLLQMGFQVEVTRAVELDSWSAAAEKSMETGILRPGDVYFF